MVTDIGIEIGRAIYAVLRPGKGVRVAHKKLGILVSQVLSFLIGGIVGALGYGAVGFLFSLPLAFVMLGISLPSLLMKHDETA
jgi:hypothetical protein